MDEFHTYFVGTMGAWVHNQNANCIQCGGGGTDVLDRIIDNSDNFPEYDIPTPFGYGANKAASGSKHAASFGESASNNYKKTFFGANPDTQGNVVVHHAVEQQVQKRYPGLVNDSEMHSLENLRGIPKEVNSDVHLSQIRIEWNRFYKQNPNPTKQQLLDKATEIDSTFGSQFNPPIDN